jgi:hypothetical protein
VVSEYRDALVTAKERVARLEALAKERGLPRASNRGRKIGAVAVALASALVYVGVRPWREPRVSTVVVVPRKAPPPAPSPLPPNGSPTSAGSYHSRSFDRSTREVA